MKLIAGIAVIVLATGCASAEQRVADKGGYRNAQVEAIRVQSEQRTARKTAEQLSQAAMWQSLSEAVKANPESASHFAIVMAVAAASGGGQSGEKEQGMVTLKTEQSDAQAWAKIIAAPVLSTITNVGIAAVNADLQKEISRNSTRRDIVESEQDGKIYDMIGVIAENRSSGDTYSVTNGGTVNTGSQDNENYIIGGNVEAADDAVDEVFSFGIPDDNGGDTFDDGGDSGTDDSEPDGGDTSGDDTDPDDTDPDDTDPDDTDDINCDEPQFSPVPPECLE